MVTLKFTQWRYSEQTIAKVIEANYIKAGEKFVRLDGQNHGRYSKGTYRATFILVRADGKQVKRSTFIAESKLMTQNLKEFSVRSNKVMFNVDGTEARSADSWHTVSKKQCTCGSFSNPTYGLKVNGFRVCKHLSAYHKQRLGAKSWSDVVNTLEHGLTEIEDSTQQLEKLKLAVEKEGQFKFSDPDYAHGLSFTIRTATGAAIAKLGYSTISGKFFYTSGMRGYSSISVGTLDECWQGFLSRNKYRYTQSNLEVSASQIFPSGFSVSLFCGQ